MTGSCKGPFDIKIIGPFTIGHMVIRHAGRKLQMQWDFQTKVRSSWNGASCLVLQVPLCNMCPNMSDFVPSAGPEHADGLSQQRQIVGGSTVLVLSISSTFFCVHKRTCLAGKRKRSCEQGSRLWRKNTGKWRTRQKYYTSQGNACMEHTAFLLIFTIVDKL